MSILKRVTVEKRPHPNADKLAITEVDGVTCICDNSEEQDYIYFPLDTVLSQRVALACKITKTRIKAVRLRGIFSEGLLISCKVLHDAGYNLSKDLDKELEVTKWCPPEDTEEVSKAAAKRPPSWWERILFMILPRKLKKKWFGRKLLMEEYVDTSRVERHIGKTLKDGVWTVKLHGTSARYGLSQGFFGKASLIVGSRRCVNPSNKLYKNVAESSGLLEKMVKIKSLLKCRELHLFGEIVGPGIQGEFKYTDKPTLFVYGIHADGVWLGFWTMRAVCNDVGLSCVQALHHSVEDVIDESLIAFLEGACKEPLSPMELKAPFREGLVWHSCVEEKASIGHRTVFKYVSQKFRER